MSDPDKRTGGSGDPKYEKPSSGEHPKEAEKHSPTADENDNDVMTDDDLPSGG